MKQVSNKMEIVVTLSEQSVDDIANAIGRQILDVMESLLRPVYDEIKDCKSELESIESNTGFMLFSDDDEMIKPK